MSHQTAQSATIRGVEEPHRGLPSDPQAQIIHFPSRSATVDLARVLAIMFMIQGHTLDVLLAPAQREGGLFNSWLFLRGLTAPTFLLLSGFSFAISTMRRWSSYRCLSSPLWRRLRRFGFFIFLGYAMHLPGRSIQAFRMLDDAGWRSWLQVDVLQCIGVTLILLQLLVFVSQEQQQFAICTAVIAISIVGGSPWVWTAGWTAYLPQSVAAYLSGQTGSLFPLFPWAGYAFLGAAAGSIWVRYQGSGVHVLKRAFFLAGPLLILAGVFLNYARVGLPATTELSAASPNLFLMRAGYVVLLLGLVGRVVKRFELPTKAVHSLAQESLTVYFLHVCILYGSIWSPGLRQWIGPTLAPRSALGWALILIFSMTMLALVWHRAKQDKPVLSRLLCVSVMVGLTVLSSR